MSALVSKMAAMYQHELRNPLQTIQAAVALLRLDGTCADEVLDTIDRNLTEISDILGEQAVSDRAGSGSATLLSALVASAISDARVRQTTRLLSFRHEIDDGEPPIRGNAADVRRALANLFRNAAEARPDAHVRVSYHWDERTVACCVEDDGPGFPPAVLTAPPASGRGLGLMMVCSALEAQGGGVSLSNAACGGARVRLTLPVATTPAGSGGPPAVAGGS